MSSSYKDHLYLLNCLLALKKKKNTFMCEEGEEVPLHPMGIGQSVSQEPSGKQNQDTGDLFFMSTSLTRYPLQVLLMWI